VGAGAISWLNYAHHLFQLPIGIIGVAIGTALLPVLSKHIKAGEKQEANTQLNRGLEISLAMSLASMIGLVLLAHPIIAVLFERGAFTMTDTEQTAKALITFAFGLPAYMMTKALSPFFYARSDTTTPVKIAVVGVILNAVLALSLMGPLGFVGIALATSITVWVNAFQYMWRLKKQGEFKLDTMFMYRIKRIILAGVIMAGALYMCFNALSSYAPAWQHKHGIMSALYLGILISIGIISFAGVLISSGGITLKDIKSFLRRG
jgi:putative peptidoglycan lipid II flippase